MTDYLVDNSVWARIASGDPAVTRRVRRIERTPSDLFLTCPPQVLEFCHSARTHQEHLVYRERIGLGFPAERAPEESLVLDLQEALWANGLIRAAAPMDLLIAGYAIVNDATVLTCDRDFLHIASVSELVAEYLQPAPAA